MKKSCFFILLSLLLPSAAFSVAGGVDEVGRQQIDKIMEPALIKAIAKKLAESFPDHLEELEKLLNDKRNEYKGTLGGSPLYSGFAKFFVMLGNKVFNDIKNENIKYIKTAAQRTGRELKEQTSADGTETILWLDRGDYLDSDACRPRFSDCANDESFECYNRMAQKFCDIPYGFEDYYIVLRNYNGLHQLYSSWDDRAGDLHLATIASWRLRVATGGGVGNLDSTFRFSELKSSYEGELRWINVSNKAFRDGAFLHGSYCYWHRVDDPKCKEIASKQFRDFYPPNEYQPTTHVFTWIQDLRRQKNSSRDKDLESNKTFFLTPEAQELLEQLDFKVDGKSITDYDEADSALTHVQNVVDKQTAQVTMKEARQNDAVSFDKPIAIDKNIQMQNNTPARTNSNTRPVGLKSKWF